MTPGREYGLALLGLGAGAGLALLAYGQTWQTSTVGQAGLPTLSSSQSGGALVPAGLALTWVLLAGVLGLVATAGRGRQVMAVVLGLAAAALAAATVSGRPVDSAIVDGATTNRVDATAWWLLALCGALICVAVAVLAVVRSATWPGMSSRYERGRQGDSPAPTTEGTPRAVWDALDRGEDPTRGPAGPAGV